MTEIQGKSIFVRVIARFDLARVRVIGSQLYLSIFMREEITVAMEPCRGWREGVEGALYMKLDFSQKLIGSLAPI